MAEMKFSCPQCGQHIGYNEGWAGHQIECPACQSAIIVPHIQTPLPSTAVFAPVSEPAKATGAKLAPGITQVARSTAHAPTPIKRAVPHPPGGDNSLLKYGVIVVVIGVLGAAGYFYGLPLISGALQQTPASNSAGGTKGSQSGGAMGGPLGEVNGAMDVSETLDGGSSSTKTRPVASTNNTARPRPARPPH